MRTVGLIFIKAILHFIHVYTDVSCSPPPQTIYWELNRCLSGWLAHVFYDRTFENCVAECQSRTSCVSINYQAVAHLCLLHTADSEEIQCGAWGEELFSDKLHWVSELPDVCRTCSDRQACQKTSFGGFACVTSECDLPTSPQNGRVLGRRAEIGANIAYACDQGYQVVPRGSRICQTDGTWSDSEPVCQLNPLIIPGPGAEENEGQDQTAVTVATTTTTSAPVATTQAFCPPEWLLFRDSCYFIAENEYGTLNEAQALCSGNGIEGYPVAIDDADEHDFISSTLFGIISNSNVRLFWTDAHRMDTLLDSGGSMLYYWVYMHSGSPITWERWETGQPNNPAEERCTVLYYQPNSINGLLHDAPCSLSGVGIVCETSSIRSLNVFQG